MKNGSDDMRADKIVMILDGSNAEDNEAMTAGKALNVELTKTGNRFIHHMLRDAEIGPCTGCLDCWTKTPGECVIDDEQRSLCVDMARSDVVILITPVTFGGYSSDLKKGMDRIIPVLLPFFRKYAGETHHPSRSGKGWNLLGIGTMLTQDEEKESLFKDIVLRNSFNMHSKCSSSLVLIKGLSNEEIGEKAVAGLRKVMA
jgi:multimeric flavodoxin WrbA